MAGPAFWDLEFWFTWISFGIKWKRTTTATTKQVKTKKNKKKLSKLLCVVINMPKILVSSQTTCVTQARAFTVDTAEFTMVTTNVTVLRSIKATDAKVSFIKRIYCSLLMMCFIDVINFQKFKWSSVNYILFRKNQRLSRFELEVNWCLSLLV